jgi:hypothetical protein
MLLALAIYVGAAAVFYAALVQSAKREPENLQEASAKWPDLVKPETGARKKAA